MTKSVDAVLMALIVTLEERAKAKGEKSIVKGVAARLADAGASPALIAEIAALRKKKADGQAPAQTEAVDPSPKAAARAKSGPKVAESKGAPEQSAVPA